MLGRMINRSTGKGRVSLVTGAASQVGIGFATAKIFAREGAKVIVSDLPSKEADGNARVAEINKEFPNAAIWIPLDATKQADWQSAIAQIESKLGPLDVLFNNAGISGPMFPLNKIPTLDTLSIEEYDTIMKINSSGVALGMIEAAKSMKKNNVEEWKSIINTSSVAGMIGGTSVPLGYSGSKWAVRGITKAAAGFGAPLKIRVNSIHPGLIKSEMTKGADWVDSSLKTTPVGDMMLQSVPAGRFGEPAEVGHLVMTLASPEASYLNGQSFVIDGGFFQA